MVIKEILSIKSTEYKKKTLVSVRWSGFDFIDVDFKVKQKIHSYSELIKSYVKN